MPSPELKETWIPTGDARVMRVVQDGDRMCALVQTPYRGLYRRVLQRSIIGVILKGETRSLD